MLPSSNPSLSFDQMVRLEADRMRNAFLQEHQLPVQCAFSCVCITDPSDLLVVMVPTPEGTQLIWAPMHSTLMQGVTTLTASKVETPVCVGQVPTVVRDRGSVM